jgi:D-3-phosphoglycerate dehydrogenase
MAVQVVITDSPWEDNSIERKILEEAGAVVVRAECSTPEQVVEACRDADVLLVGWAPIPQTAIAGLKRCRLMVRYGTGFNNIDAEAAASAGIGVAINSDYCIEEVAEHALALILACHRQLGPLAHAVREGVWDPMLSMAPMPPLSKRTVGIVGLGRIGRRLAEMVRPLVARVVAYDPAVEAGAAPARVELLPLKGCLQSADFLSIHAPLQAATHHLLSRETLAMMKPSAWIVNCSRGPLIDEDALVAALRAKRLAGAALDVFATEPLPMEHPLRSFPNVMITPHAAWYSEQANYNLRACPARAIVRFLRGEKIALVNRPAVRAVNP